MIHSNNVISVENTLYKTGPVFLFDLYLPDGLPTTLLISMSSVSNLRIHMAQHLVKQIFENHKYEVTYGLRLQYKQIKMGLFDVKL